MSPRRIKCIVRSTKHADRDRRVLAVGGVDGGRWKDLEDDAIKAVKSDADAYCVLDDGKWEPVVVKPHEGREYLMTRNGRFLTDPALNLPDCPQ